MCQIIQSCLQMKKIIPVFSSTITMAVLMAIFALSIATATFIENDFGSAAAMNLVYHSKWFELLLLTGVINIIAVTLKRKVYKKPAIFLFHVSFILIVMGAGITRYAGFEGTMHIREGDSSDIVETGTAYITLQASFGEEYVETVTPVNLDPVSGTDFKKKISLGNKKLAISLEDYYPSASPVLEADPEGMPVSSTTHSAIPEALLFKLCSGSEEKEIWYWGRRDEYGEKSLSVINGMIINIQYGVKKVQLPFRIRLDDFILTRYPGSDSPSWFESKVTVIDRSGQVNLIHRIYMNHILKYKGYRFYQASFDNDEAGTLLAVNYDKAGTGITYTGYLLMALGMLLSLFNKRSRFSMLVKESGRIKEKIKHLTLSAILLLLIVPKANGKESGVPVVDAHHACLFGSILVQDHAGRIKPLNTLSSEIMRKLTRQNKYNGMSPDQVFLGIMVFPETWQNEPLIKVGHHQINEILDKEGERIPFASFFSGEQENYLLSSYISEASARKPVYRSKFDNELIRTDERVNLFYMVYSGFMLKIFPKPEDPENNWYSPLNTGGLFYRDDSAFVAYILPYYISKVKEAVVSSDWSEADEVVHAIKNFQRKNGGSVLPSELRTKLELLYNRLNLFERLFAWYGLSGLILLFIQLAVIFHYRRYLKLPLKILEVLIVMCFVMHAFTLAGRWFISGHAPWSNGYEAMTFIAWTSVLAGIIFSGRSPVALSTTAILASVILHTAHLSWMDPEITTLVPVLRSYWLIIHVAVITTSYGFLGLGALLAVVNLIIMVLESRRTRLRIDLTIQELSNIIEMTLIAGLYLMTIGSFLGAVWANESWGRYWGWDPKETWALVTIIVYAFILHLRIVPGFKSRFGFNIAALLGFGSVIMTYFGVNYYLSGLHSYAKGDPLPMPLFISILIVAIVLLVIPAYINQRRLKKDTSSV
jgi:cytochrome c-type biogenesis protein CcsB